MQHRARPPSHKGLPSYAFFFVGGFCGGPVTQKITMSLKNGNFIISWWLAGSPLLPRRSSPQTVSRNCLLETMNQICYRTRTSWIFGKRYSSSFVNTACASGHAANVSGQSVSRWCLLGAPGRGNQTDPEVCTSTLYFIDTMRLGGSVSALDTHDNCKSCPEATESLKLTQPHKLFGTRGKALK